MWIKGWPNYCILACILKIDNMKDCHVSSCKIVIQAFYSKLIILPLALLKQMMPYSRLIDGQYVSKQANLWWGIMAPVHTMKRYRNVTSCASISTIEML